MIQRKQQDNKLNWLAIGAVTLIGLALFPYGWLAERWSLAGQVADFIFGTELAHVIGHLILFAVLGTAVLTTLPRLQRHPRLYFTLILGLGLVQEILQLVSFKQRPFAANELLDIIVDLSGAFIAFYWLTRERRLETDK
jgi:VanZ family protein